MKKTAWTGWVVLFAVSCAGPDEPSALRGNAALGIADFEIDDTPTRTRVVGLDENGVVVGQLDLVHGRFALTGIFREDYETAEVVGRDLRVEIAGQQLIWQTAGFQPTLHMPAHPPGREKLAAFLDDPHVRTVLERWRIGFEPSREGALATAPGTGEIAITVSPLQAAPPFETGAEPGDFVMDCSGATNCGRVRGFVANSCGGGGAMSEQAIRITRPAAYDEELIAQCCPTGAAGRPKPWFAIKVCPHSSDVSSCGEIGVACKGCPGYPVDASRFCEMAYRGGALHYCHSDTPGHPGNVPPACLEAR